MGQSISLNHSQWQITVPNLTSFQKKLIEFQPESWHYNRNITEQGHCVGHISRFFIFSTPFFIFCQSKETGSVWEWWRNDGGTILQFTIYNPTIITHKARAPCSLLFLWNNKTIDNLWWLSIGLEWQLFASTLPDFIIFYSLPPNNFGTLPMAASIMLHLKLSEIYNSIVHSLNIVSECTLTYSRLQHTGNDDI